MQIVIDIPENEYKELKQTCENFIPLGLLLNLRDYVRKGTPLPKVHGALKDADEIKKHKYHDNNRCENVVAVAQIDWADTIIEADKE